LRRRAGNPKAAIPTFNQMADRAEEAPTRASNPE
jgi:hypothetical protein